MDLVPNIAFGDLGQSSLAEVVAAGFRAFATGTVAIEQGRGESRLYFRYGIPCGVQLYAGFKPFGHFLVEHGVLRSSDLDRLLERVSGDHGQLGELLVSDRKLPKERVVELVTEHHYASLGSLCALREGKYELRGWERPPEWTEAISLDPLIAVSRAFAADELFDRRREILDRIGDSRLRLADDYNDQVTRLAIRPGDQEILARLRAPQSASELVRAVGREDVEASLAALALLGLVDVAEGAADAPEESVLEDASLLLVPIEPTIPPPASVTMVAGEPSFLRPASTSAAPAAPRPQRTNTQLLEQVTPDLTSSELSEIGLGPPEIHDLSAHTPSPAPSTQAVGRREVEFEPVNPDEPALELDLMRAAPSTRERLGSSMLRPRGSRQSSLASPSMPSVSTSSSGKVISVIGQKSSSKGPEYNPFSVHFRQAVNVAADLEARLDRALREGLSGPRSVPPLTPPRPRVDDYTQGAFPPEAGSLPAQILADIADVVGDMTEVGKPLTFAEPEPSRTSDDDLALLAARESAAQPDEEEEVVESDDAETSGVIETDASADEDEGVDVTIVSSPNQTLREIDETSARIAPTSTGRQTTTGPQTTGPQLTGPQATGPQSTDGAAKPGEDPEAIRRRLRLRAMRNVAGGILAREPTGANVRRPDTPEARPAIADAELEKDVATRVSKLVNQDHFARLGLDRNADTEQVKESFLSLAKRYHPDRITAMGQNHLLPQVRELFARIKESYDVLVDPAGRARYVAELNEKEGAKSKASPEEAKAAFVRATVYLKKRDFTNAEAELVRAVAADPQAEYLAELAWTLHQNPARRDDARAEIRDLVARSMKTGVESDRAFVVAAYIARADNETDKAERYFRKAFERNPKNIEAARELRLIEQRRGSEKKTGGIFDKLRSKNPAGTGPTKK